MLLRKKFPLKNTIAATVLTLSIFSAANALAFPIGKILSTTNKALGTVEKIQSMTKAETKAQESRSQAFYYRHAPRPQSPTSEIQDSLGFATEAQAINSYSCTSDSECCSRYPLHCEAYALQ